jgi:hypothetical protein
VIEAKGELRVEFHQGKEKLLGTLRPWWDMLKNVNSSIPHFNPSISFA